jgi:hypothetical protein
VVQPGDTATRIARQYGVSLADLATTNPGTDLDHLAIGESLVIAPPDVAATTRFSPVVWPAAHYPSFAISPDGVVVRSLSPLPPAAQSGDVLPAPYHSQFDGTIWAESDCGPTTLAMALGALGVAADQLKLRDLANRQMGDDDPDNGTSWESLAYAAAQYGVATSGLNAGASYRVWTLDDLRAELAQGRPVMLLVRFWDLPDHLASSFAGDHYILALGFDPAGDLVYHDPAMRGDGSYRTIGRSQLLKAWSDPADGEVRAAMAFYR